MPLPIIRSPVVVIGDKALKAADAVVCPVPPLATATVPVTFAALPPMERLEAVPVNPVPAPANDVALKTPVLGTKLSLVDDVVAPTFPVVADEMTG